MRAKMLVVYLAAAGVAMAQQKIFEKRIEVVAHGEGTAEAMMVHEQGGVPGGATIQFISAEVGMPGKLVKGAPYTAEAVTETVQTLADGNRITRKTTAQVARDGEGRTRRHDKIGGIGPWAANEAHELIFINDPVAKLSWVLEVGDKTARKMPLPPGDLKPGGLSFAGDRMVITHREQAPSREAERDIAFTSRHASAPAKTESLGKRNVEGVVAEGTRTTTTIPAGDMGNDRPIEIVSERWFSPELQTAVMTRHNDPRFGETTYRLTNIVRAEPPRSLFEVPPDYQVKEVRGDVRITRKEKKQ